MVPHSDQLKALEPLPADVPLVAIAGEITITTDLFGSALNAISTGPGGLWDDGGTGSCQSPQRSPKRRATPGMIGRARTKHHRELRLSSYRRSHSLERGRGRWSRLTAHPCHARLTRTTDLRWQADILGAIKPAAQALRLGALPRVAAASEP